MIQAAVHINNIADKFGYSHAEVKDAIIICTRSGVDWAGNSIGFTGGNGKGRLVRTAPKGHIYL